MLETVQAQTLATATLPVELSSRRLVSYRAVLWAVLLTYPFTAILLSRSAGLAYPALAALCVALSYAWAIGAPVAAWFALCEADRVRLNRREHPQVVRETILAAVAAPFYVLSG